MATQPKFEVLTSKEQDVELVYSRSSLRVISLTASDAQDPVDTVLDILFEQEKKMTPVRGRKALTRFRRIADGGKTPKKR